MRKTAVFLIFFLTLIQTFAQDWQPLKLPFGNDQTRFRLIKVPMNAIIETSYGKSLDVDSFYQKLSEADIVLIGESHTNDTHHALQLNIIKGLLARGKTPALGLEMFNPTQNAGLANYAAGAFEDSEFAKNTDYFNTWGHNLRYYLPIFSCARENGLPIQGVNIPSDRLKELKKTGLDGLEKALMEGEAFPDTTNQQHRFFIETMMQGIGAQAPGVFDGIYLTQCLWDANMAQGLIEMCRALEHRPIICLAGSGHVAYGLGIARLVASRSNLKTVTVMPVDIAEPKSKKNSDHPGFMVHMKKGSNQKPEPASTIVSAGLADFLIGVKAEKQERYPAPPFKVFEKDGQLVVGGILPGTWAYKAGFRKNDIIISLNSRKWQSAHELNLFLHNLNWDETLRAKVRRDAKTINLKRTVSVKE